ncbi:hypothetical protein [Acidobacterium sp. S8]|uniref:hypothetical protein n=1 Tax=Acidobacterium sp. S8 TaxID=1641854 RepID=UPI00131CC27E|nr:hypothetical protein [Acidobacterium sp. S8]
MTLYHNNPDEQIDAALRRLASAAPPPDLEQRVRARLRHKSAERKTSGGKLMDFFFGQRIVFASAAAGLVGFMIVVGSVQHSHQRAFSAPAIHLPSGNGLGAASSTHIAPAPIAVPEHSRARSEHKVENGRATVSRDARKPKGVAVPESTAPEKP